MQFPPEIEGGSFGEHVNNLRGTMFYVCQGSCLCGTVNNRGKVIYCYGDLVPRHGELFSETTNNNNKASPRDLLAAQLGIWVFGLIALLVVLLLIRKSISSLRQHIEKVTERLPWYHDDDDLLSNNSTATSPHIHGKDTTLESMGSYVDLKTPDIEEYPRSPTVEFPTTPPPPMGESDLETGFSKNTPGWFGNVGTIRTRPTNKLKKLRLKGKDFKKGGEALRGKNVIEAYRVKEKDLKRTMK
ncbi:uncharacterized protein LOC111715930 isoform X2 [Eurytemora carolleeae]|uniref:uncharacterized protein LOC111715930 isoform X2 n=1 Tax=Eurytemora carolleeae TaxID=1294199 RepID=UPI000C75BAEB|nr:uncharacterized protein LOC111715930 isoform X2 [Eurytemora carolleeae]|eukprot:XP_023347118.1 uncharacterized protein LOC111715930 isoform X2 [Eurytemora affinis]